MVAGTAVVNRILRETPTGALRDLPTARVFEPLLMPRRYKGARGGRGSGKSHFYAGTAIEICCERPSSRIVCVREIQHSLEQSVKRLLEDKISMIGARSRFDIKQSHIDVRARRKSEGDGVIIFRGMQNHTDEAIKSLEGYDVAWVEEAQSLSESSLTKLYPTLRKPGSQIWFSWNPRSPKDPVERFMFVDPHPESICVTANYDDNPWFPDELRRDMEYDRRRDYDRYRHVWLGEYQVRSEAAVFRNFEVEPFDTPPDATFYFGADWGFSVDPTVLIRCFIKGQTLFVDRECWQVGCELIDTPALFDRLDPDRPGMARKWTIVADSSDPQIISHMRQHGYDKMVSSVKGANSVAEGVTFIQSYDVVIHPRCVHAADEFASYSWEIDKRTEQVLPKLADKKNHTIDSLRYAVEPLRGKGRPAAYGSY